MKTMLYQFCHCGVSSILPKKDFLQAGMIRRKEGLPSSGNDKKAGMTEEKKLSLQLVRLRHAGVPSILLTAEVFILARK